MTYAFSRAALTLTGMIFLGACGQVAYQRGSGPDAFPWARAACRQQNPAPAAVRACLEQAGWAVTDLAAGAPDDAPAPTPPPGPAARSTQDAAATQSVPPVPTAATGKIAVGAWWKFGAGSADLDSAAAACAAALGPADQPAPGYHLVTRALYACLTRHGWHGVGR